MKKSKKHQDDAVRAYRDFIEHLRHEVHKKDREIEKLEALRDKLLSENTELREDNILLETENARLAAENDALKGRGRLFTDLPDKAERLERALLSARERVDELTMKNETLQVRYDEAEQAVRELTDKLENIQNGAGKTFHEIGLMPEISEEEAEKIFFNKETKKDGEDDDC